MKHFVLGADIFESEDEVKNYIKDFAEWEDVARATGKTYTCEDPNTYRDYQEARTDLTISEMEECFNEYLDNVIEAIKMGEEKFGFTYQEIGYKLELWDSEAIIESSGSLSIVDWAPIQKKEIIMPDVCEMSGYEINHPKKNKLTNVHFAAHVILTEKEWEEANEQITSGKCSLETIFRDKFNDSAKENKFTIVFRRVGSVNEKV